MLNSASSWPKAVPMSVLSGMPSPSLSSPKISVWIDLAQRAAVGGEVLLDADGAAAEGHDREHVRRLHLRVDEGLRRGVGAHLIGGRHRGEIEVEDQQPAIAIAGVAGRRNRDLSLRRRRHADRGAAKCGAGVAARALGRPIGQPLELDEADRLRLVVFGDDEVGGRESLDGAAVLVLDADRLHDQPGATPEDWLLRGRQGHRGNKGSQRQRRRPLCPLFPLCP